MERADRQCRADRQADLGRRGEVACHHRRETPRASAVARARGSCRDRAPLRPPRIRGQPGAAPRGRLPLRARRPGHRPDRRAPPRRAGRRRRSRTRPPARRSAQSLPVVSRQAAIGEQGAELEQGGVGGEGEEPVRSGRDGLRPESPRSARSPRSRPPASPRTSGAEPSPGARVPAQITRRTPLESSSKSASQIQETSRPSAIRSLSAIQRSIPPFDDSSVRVLSTSLAPAGFLIRRIETGLPETSIVSTRPKTACMDSSPSRISSSEIPERSAAATAASAL